MDSELNQEKQEENRTESTKICDSCGKTEVLHEVPHHQVGNITVFHYCETCTKAAIAEADRLSESGIPTNLTSVKK